MSDDDGAAADELRMWLDIQAGRFDVASATAARLLITTADRSQRGRLEAAVGIMLQRAGLMADAREQFTRAIDLVADSPSEQATFLAVSSLSNVLGGDLPGARDQALRAQRLGERSGTWFAVRQARTTLAAVHLGEGDPRQALAEARRAVVTATEGEGAQAEYRSTAYVLMGMALGELDRMPEAHEAIATGIRMAREEGDTGQLAWYLASQSLLHLLDGSWDVAVAEARRSLEVGDETGAVAPRPLAWGVWATIEGVRANSSAARDLVARARSNRMGPYGGLGEEWVALATAVTSEDHQEQYDALCEAWFRLRGVPFLVAWRMFAPELVRLAVARGDLAVARAVTDRALVGAERASGVASASATGLRCRALLERDPVAAQEAVELLREVGRPFVFASAAVDAARLWARAGERDRALGLLREAAAVFHRLRAARWTAMTGRMVIALSATASPVPVPAAAPPDGWERLTPAERGVARLAAEGLTNPQIAGELSLSARTVQSHMAHICAKFGISSRVQLAAMLSGRDLA